MRRLKDILVVCDEHGAARIEVHDGKRVASDAMVRPVREGEVDAIIMGTAGRVGVAGVVIGNTAKTILGRAACSMLAIKPAERMLPEPTPGVAAP